MTCANGADPLGLSWENVTVSNDGKAAARGIAVGIGSPQQIVALAPSIGDANTWLFNAADCVSASNSSCIGQKGGVYNATLSDTFVQTTEVAWNGTELSSQLDAGSYIFFNDDLHFGSNGSSLGFPLLLDQPGYGGYFPCYFMSSVAYQHFRKPEWVGHWAAIYLSRRSC